MYSDFNFVEEFKKDWNEKIKKLRWTCLILSILMIIVGFVCLFFPIKTFNIMKIIVSIVFICFGIYSIVTYCLTTLYFKDPIMIMIGITHILFGVLLFQMPTEITAMSLTMMLAIMLLFYGAQKIAFSRRLSFFGLIDTNIYTMSGIMTIMLSIIFMVLPLTSAIIINYIIAAYLIVDGITLFIEAINMKKLKE